MIYRFIFELQHLDAYKSRKLLRSLPRQITTVLNADVLWGMGITGAGVKVQTLVHISCSTGLHLNIFLNIYIISEKKTRVNELDIFFTKVN